MKDYQEQMLESLQSYHDTVARIGDSKGMEECVGNMKDSLDRAVQCNRTARNGLRICILWNWLSFVCGSFLFGACIILLSWFSIVLLPFIVSFNGWMVLQLRGDLKDIREFDAGIADFRDKFCGK